MTSDDMGLTHAPPRAGTPAHPSSWQHPRQLDRLLEEKGLVVVDVVAGAASGTRRLYVAKEVSGGDVRYAVAVPNDEAGDQAVATEATVLLHLQQRLPPAHSAIAPRVVEWVAGPGGRPALLVTAVAGLDSTGARPASTGETRLLLHDAVGWLAKIWESTSGDRIPVQLGRGPVDLLLGRYRGAATVRPAIGVLVRARQRIAEVEVTSTVTHGCLSPRHLHQPCHGPLGVDDWGLGSSCSDPLRDLGRVAVDLSAGQLPEVIAGRSTLANAFRRAVCLGLEALSVPPRLWRDVLLLSQLEAAVAELARGEPRRLAVLQQAVLALP
jgi:hypothetical protein